MSLSLDVYINQTKTRVDTLLEQLSRIDNSNSNKLDDAINYAIATPGKRIRPVLTYATAALFSSQPTSIVDDAAIAVELIHTQSLVHDDLPAMDNDTLRRGKPTCHVVYGEADAILTGNAMVALAFEILSKKQDNPTERLKLIEFLSKSIGNRGINGGQSLDINCAKKLEISIAELKKIHSLKTGALIKASILMGAIAANASATDLDELCKFADCIGLAFQIVDDILDETATTEQLGKKTQKDQKHAKHTYPRYLGIEKSKEAAHLYFDQAISNLLNITKDTTILQNLAELIVTRKH